MFLEAIKIVGILELTPSETDPNETFGTHPGWIYTTSGESTLFLKLLIRPFFSGENNRQVGRVEFT